jgi:hypothetical protein
MQSGGVVCCMKSRFKLDPGPDQVDHCSIVGVKGGGNLGISSGTDAVVAGFASRNKALDRVSVARSRSYCPKVERLPLRLEPPH